MTTFLEFLKQPGDTGKATAAELTRVKKILDEYGYTDLPFPIPYCIVDKEDQLNEEILTIHAFVMAWRDDAEIAIEDIAKLIGFHNVRETVDQVIFFYTTKTKEEIAERGNPDPVIDEPEAEKPKAKKVVKN